MTFSTGRGVVGATLVGLLLACALIAGNRYVGVSYRDVSPMTAPDATSDEDLDMVTVSWRHCPPSGGSMTITVTQGSTETDKEFIARVERWQGTWEINCGEDA